MLDDLLDEVTEAAQAVIEAKNPALPDRERVAAQVALGALVFNDLKRERIKDVIFDEAEILSFEGDTGPYLQFTHARLASILRKAVSTGDAALASKPDWSALENAGEILVSIGRFADVVRSAGAKAEPSELSQYLLALARDVSTWVSSSENRVLGTSGPEGAARVALVRCAKSCLGNGLRLIGIPAPEEM